MDGRHWFVKWFEGFWKRHGDRLIFLFLANLSATVLCLVGWKTQEKTLLGAGVGIAVGSAQLFFNKARGQEKKE